MICRWQSIAWSGPSHYLYQHRTIFNRIPSNKRQCNFNRNSYIFIKKNPFENVVWKMAAILSRPQSAKYLLCKARCDIGTNFWSKVNILNVNCARATAFIFDTRQSFWDRKCTDLRGTRTPNIRIHAECSKLLSYQGQTFAVPCCWILALVV